jgi:UDP-glucose 4-epimerase
MKILITGANGFVGRALLETLAKTGYSVVGITRKDISNIDERTDWSSLLKDVDVVIHAAARVHMMQDASQNPLLEYRKTNTQGTLKLLKDSIAANVKKFIFISSIKVNGEFTKDKHFSEEDKYIPEDPYGLSKWEAEQGIIELTKNTTTKFTIVRLPLVYGVGVKANFKNLIKLVRSNLPLPFGCIHNKRSMLYLGNLISAIEAIIQNSVSNNQTYLLSDNDDVSTAELVKKIAKAYGLKRYLIPVPLFLFKWLGAMTGKHKAVSRLLGSLQVDSRKIRRELNWKTPYTVKTGLSEMVQQEKEVLG